MAKSDKKINRIVSFIRKGVKGMQDPSVTLINKKSKSPFLVLISCMLSLRTKDKVTLSASKRLFNLSSKPEGIVNLDIKKIKKAIYPVGFYKTKAQNIKRLCRDLVDNFDSRVPDDIGTLLKFRGVGRKTANLVLTEGFNKPGICVDTHVHRISNRLGYVKTKTPEETEWALRKKLPKRFWIEYNVLLVTWGQNICKPISPLCSSCKIKKLCPQIDVNISR